MFWKALTLGPPGGVSCVQLAPIVTPRLYVSRLEYSVDMSNSLADGSSPFLNSEIVGSDSSSATQGSSKTTVAGEKRAPTKQWADASPLDRTAAAAAPTASLISRSFARV